MLVVHAEMKVIGAEAVVWVRLESWPMVRMDKGALKVLSAVTEVIEEMSGRQVATIVLPE